MRKITLFIFIFALLTLMQLAIADVEVSNESDTDAWLVYTHYMTAGNNYPAGWRTMGWYKVKAGESRILPVQVIIGQKNSVYVRATLPYPSVLKPTNHSKTTPGFLMHPSKSFTAVEKGDGTGTLLKSNQPANQLVRRTFYKYDNNSYLRISSDKRLLIGGGDGGLTIIAPSIVEPKGGSFSGSIPLTFTLKAAEDSPVVGKRVHLSTSHSGGVNSNLDSTTLTTNASGQATTTLRLQNSSTGSVKVTARVDGSDVSKSHTITVKQTASSLSVSGVPSSLTSGNSRSITATVTSRNGTPMSGVTVRFSESSSYLRFSSTKGATNSSGQVSSTLQTGGETSEAFFTVSASGVSSKSYTVRVNVGTQSVNRSIRLYSHKGSWRECTTHRHELDWRWSDRKYANFPGKVLSYSLRVSRDQGVAHLIDVADILYEQYNAVSWNSDMTQVGIAVWTREHCWDPYTVNVTISATCRSVASLPGAPSLQPQLRPDMDHLSMFWEDVSQVPSETVLLPNYPNPFNPETWIPYHLAESADVTLTVYSSDGRLVRTLALGHQAAGFYQSKSRAAYWDGRNNVGERVASGLYFYTLTAGDFSATGKMLILK